LFDGGRSLFHRIALLEFLGNKATEFPIQIFATDISKSAIERARSGIYLENMTADMTQERLRRFFVKTDEGYQINKTVREMCVFARHDVARDPPFSRLDLISCRNLLIYFSPVLQKKVIPFFEYGLKPGGFLLLGTSEMISGSEEQFTLVDKKHKIYSRRSTGPRHLMDFGANDHAAEKEKTEKKVNEVGTGLNVQKAVDRILFRRYREWLGSLESYRGHDCCASRWC